MEQFKRLTQGTTGKVIALIIVLPFVAAGFYGYFAGGAGADQVAEVGGQTVSKNQLANRLQQSRQQLRQSNPNITAEALAKAVSPSSVLDGLISNALLDQAADADNMVVSQDQVSSEVIDASLFQDANGNFSKQVFKQYVSRLGYSPTAFFSLLQRQEARQQLKSGYMLTAFATPSSLASQIALAGQKRSVDYIKLDRADQIANSDPTNEQAKAWYQSHKSDYVRPAQIRINWLEISADNYDITPTEDQIQQEYNARKLMLENNAKSNQKRQLADIFIAVNKDRSEQQAKTLANEIKQKISNGDKFSALAAKYSNDPGTAQAGGKLGWLQKDALPDALGSAVFALKKGEVSEPISVDNGIHLIKVEAIQAVDIPKLAEMRPKIIKELKTQDQQARITTDSNTLGDLAFEHADLVDISNQMGLDIQTSDWFDPNNPTGFVNNPNIIKALHDDDVMEHKQNSRLLDLGDDRYAVIHLAERRSATQLSFSQVSDAALKDLAVNQANQQFADLAKAAAQAASLQQVAKQWKAPIQKAPEVTRQSSQLPTAILVQLFQLPPLLDQKPAVVRDDKGNLWALALTAVEDGPSIPDEQQSSALAQLSLINGESDFNAYLDWLQSTTKISVNQERLGTLN